MPDTVTPEVLWAQRSNATDAEKNVLFITISAPDVAPSDAKLNLTPTSISFTGESKLKKVIYHVDLELYDAIDVDNSKTHHSPRGMELALRKKEAKAEFWPRLLKEAKKVHFLKTDFDKWVDEDEQEEVEDDYSNFGGLGEGSGLGGIDFSKLGAGAGGDDAFGGGEEGEDEDDEDMPELEAEAPESASKPKIEEVSSSS